MNQPNDGDLLDLEIMARRDGWGAGVSFYMRQVTVGDGAMVAQNVVMKHMEPGTMPPAFMNLTMHQAQQFIDQLWDCGLRPTEGTGSAGAMAAQAKHLEDMRTLVFKCQVSPCSE